MFVGNVNKNLTSLILLQVACELRMATKIYVNHHGFIFDLAQ